MNPPITFGWYWTPPKPLNIPFSNCRTLIVSLLMSKDAKPRSGFTQSTKELTHIKVCAEVSAKTDTGSWSTQSCFRPKSFTLKPIAPYGHRLVADLYFPKTNAKRKVKVEESPRPQLRRSPQAETL